MSKITIQKIISLPLDVLLVSSRGTKFEEELWGEIDLINFVRFKTPSTLPSLK